MPEDPESLDVLIRVPTEAEASIIVQFLADQGIAARAVGGFTSGFKAEAPGDASVLVKHADLEKARNALLRNVSRGLRQLRYEISVAR